MKTIETSLPGVLLVESPVFEDTRGFFTEVFHSEKFSSIGLPTQWAQENLSRSVRHTLRGLHYQLEEPQGKLVRVVSGSIFDVAVDIRSSSAYFGKWVGVTLTEGEGRQMWIPPGFAHGFLVLSASADISYMCTTMYRGPADRSIAWNDPTIGIVWPLAEQAPLLSAKDAAAVPLSAAETLA